MNVDATPKGKVLLVTVAESRIDAAISVAFKERMRELTVGHPGRIIVDMSAVGFLDSSGLGAVVGAMKQVDPGATLELAGLTSTVAKVFKLTRMDTVFAIHSSAEAALAADENAA
ncbi:STAS domain-containing protein [Vannielia litorea]|uniref:STAS domain-containing protein n=1 Tax=Vannielia TaxID=2813041 RepID=UPI001C94A0DD|nr:STAS domain-containing protein [Vannielia litorea]MBY6049181.1 STAS domain-containing protein [Vannielia litorea]MBY6076595.1 STAS domain-containing protein [Vannielia litorea]MBY6154833.1 STAS domain-containing protein [Vannielia litorea]